MDSSTPLTLAESLRDAAAWRLKTLRWEERYIPQFGLFEPEASVGRTIARQDSQLQRYSELWTAAEHIWTDDLIAPIWHPEMQSEHHRRQIIVSSLARRRHSLLEEQDYTHENVNSVGRILAYAPDGSLRDGASELASEDFLNSDDLPPCGNWIGYISLAPAKPERYYDSYLMSWVSEEHVPWVQAGIDINAADCIWWLSPMGSLDELTQILTSEY